MNRLNAQERLIDFTSYTNKKYKVSGVHQIIASALDDVLSGKIDRLQLKVPPRHGKSELASRKFPAYCLGHHPDWQIISASATKELAEDFGQDVRDLVNSKEYSNVFNTALNEDSQAKGKWRTTLGGFYYTVGVGGTIMGRGGNLIIIDDPFSSWDDAQSDLSREKVWRWYTNTIYNRLEANARIVVINHRMHEDDLCGRLDYQEQHGGDKWVRVSLPAISPEGAALWPERYPIPELMRRKAISMPRAWSALYQQDPTADEGTYFSRAKFNRYTDHPQSLNVYITGDFAVSEDKGDYTDIGVWGVDHDENCYMLDWWFGQKTADVWIDALLDLCERWSPIRFVAEGGVIRRAVEPFLSKRMVSRGTFVACEWLPSNADKPALARSFQGLVEMGKVYFPHTDKAERVIDQCVRFPGGRYDDAVDACSLFGRHIANTWKASGPESSAVALTDAWNAPLTIGDVIHG